MKNILILIPLFNIVSAYSESIKEETNLSKYERRKISAHFLEFEKGHTLNGTLSDGSSCSVNIQNRNDYSENDKRVSLSLKPGNQLTTRFAKYEDKSLVVDKSQFLVARTTSAFESYDSLRFHAGFKRHDGALVIKFLHASYEDYYCSRYLKSSNCTKERTCFLNKPIFIRL